MEKLTEYEYELLNQCVLNPDAMIDKLRTDFILYDNGAHELIYSKFNLDESAQKNLRLIVENLITKYYLCHNNKKPKSHDQNQNAN